VKQGIRVKETQSGRYVKLIHRKRGQMSHGIILIGGNILMENVSILERARFLYQSQFSS